MLACLGFHFRKWIEGRSELPKAMLAEVVEPVVAGVIRPNCYILNYQYVVSQN